MSEAVMEKSQTESTKGIRFAEPLGIAIILAGFAANIATVIDFLMSLLTP